VARSTINTCAVFSSISTMVSKFTEKITDVRVDY
jgi:hypothetical protein